MPLESGEGLGVVEEDPPPIGTSLWRIVLFPWPEHAPWGKNEIAEGYGPQTPPKKFPHPIPPPTSSYLLGV